MTYDEFKNFKPQFEAIRSFAGRIEAAKQYFGKPIGSGSGRMVFSVDDDKVLKLAKNAKGIAQNEAETGIGYYHDTQHIVTKVFDSDDNNSSWLVSEKGKKVNERRIKELTGIPSLNDLYMYLRNFTEQNNGKKKMFGQSEEIVDLLNENEFAQDLDNFIANYNQSAGDMGRPSSYGEVLRDGQPSIVLTDYGLNDEVYNTYYAPKRQAYRMYELYNFADGNDDILSDAGGGMDIRHGMWAQMPYGVGDGDGVINEEFVHFVSNRDKYPNIPMPSMPYIVEGFHDIVNNLKEILDNHKDKKGFYKNLLILQDYLIRQKFYDREPLALEEYSIGKKEVLNEVTYDRETADEIAKEVAAKKGLSAPKYIGGGLFGYAYDIGNNLILKITNDNSEAFENMELLGKPLKYIAKPYNVFQIKSLSRFTGRMYAIVLEKLRTDESSFEARMKRLKYVFEKILKESMVSVILTYVNGNNGYVDTDKVEKYLTKNPQDMEFFNALLNIAKELKKYGVESVEYTNPKNLGYTKDGDIGLFDVGFTDLTLNPKPEQIDLYEFGGDSLYSHTDSIGGDEFPTYNTNDTSPSIQNDLNANSAMYNEDLDYNRVSDATQDEYVIDERVMSSMAGSSTVDVKKKCRLAGNGNTSTACNQGDISNLNIKPLREIIALDSPIGSDGWKSYKIMNDGQPVGEMELTAYHNHKNYIQLSKIFINKDQRHQGYAQDAMELLINYADTNKKILVLTPDNVWGASKEKLKKWYKTFGFVMNSGRNTDFTTRESMYRLPKGMKFGQSLHEELLGTIDYEDEDFKDPIEAFKNPKSIKNMKPDIRGVIDSKTGDFYVANAVNFLHAALNFWLNNKLGFNYATDFNLIYQNPFKIVPVQRDDSTNVFKLGELYTSAFDADEMEKLMPQIQKVLDMAKAKNPEIEFSTEVIDTPTYPLREDIDASEAYRDEDGLQTIIDGKRNIAGFVTYNRKDVIRKLEDTGLNILPLTGNPHGLVIVFNDRGRENAMKLWKYATSKGGYFEDNTPEEARFIGKMLQYTDDSIKRFIHRIYDENGQRRKKIYNEESHVININEYPQQMVKAYGKTGLYDKEDMDAILSVTGGDPYTKWIADIFYYLTNRYNKKTATPTKLTERDRQILVDAHENIKRYDKNIIPIHDLYAQEHNAHPLDKMNDLRTRELIIEKLRKFPSILLRNLRADIRVERDHYELNELFQTVKEIQNILKLLEQVKPENREKIYKKVFSSANDTFAGIKKRLDDTTIPYLSQGLEREDIIKKVDDMGNEAEILYDNNNILVVKIMSAEAMGYIGCSSQWCFASNPEHYWDNYTNHGFATIVFNFNEPESEPNRMVVVLEDGSVYGMYNEYIEDGYQYLSDIGVNDVINQDVKDYTEVDKHFSKIPRMGEVKNFKESVGDKYDEKRFNVKPEFSDFEDKYSDYLGKQAQDEVVYDDTNMGGTLKIIKNPKSLSNIGPNVRGVIDREGNFYTEQKVSGKVHNAILGVLEDLKLISENRNWTEVLPVNFITVMRLYNTNDIYLGESNTMMTPTEDRDPHYYGEGYWETFPTYEEAEPVFQSFMNSAKAKNPRINFINKNIVYTEYIKEYNNSDNGVDGLENSSTFAAEIPVTNSSELMKEEIEIKYNIKEARQLM
jgi:hypothetical protein